MTGLATLSTLARFSEAFLILRAQAAGLPVALAPLVLVAMNLVYALAAWPAGLLSDRINRISVLMAGFVLLLAADLVLATSGGLVGVGLGVLLWGLHLGFSQGLLATLVADAAPTDMRGTGFGMFNLLGGLALLAASVAAGALWDHVGPQAPFLAGAGIAALSLLGLAVVRRRAPEIGAPLR